MDEARVTVAVVPRERSSRATTNLQSLLENTSAAYELIYLEADLPQAVSWKIEALLKPHDYSLIRSDRYLSAFEATALAIENTRTEYLVLVDNDMYLRPGWLTAMLRCVDEEEADVVTPLILFGDPDSDIIHAAGGESYVEILKDETSRYHDLQWYEWKSVNDSAVELRRRPSQLAEAHCILASLETWRGLGELDPTVGPITNVVELAQGFRETGASIWFEPKAEVVYQFGPTQHFSLDDVRLMNYVWSEAWITRDLARMSEKYRVTPKDRYWFANQRRCWLRPVEARMKHTASRLHVPILGHIAWKFVELFESICNRAYISFSRRFGWARAAAQIHLTSALEK